MSIFGLDKEDWKEMFSLKEFVRAIKHPHFWKGTSGAVLIVSIMLFIAMLSSAATDIGVSEGLANWMGGYIAGMFVVWALGKRR